MEKILKRIEANEWNAENVQIWGIWRGAFSKEMNNCAIAVHDLKKLRFFFILEHKSSRLGKYTPKRWLINLDMVGICCTEPYEGDSASASDKLYVAEWLCNRHEICNNLFVKAWVWFPPEDKFLKNILSEFSSNFPRQSHKTAQSITSNEQKLHRMLQKKRDYLLQSCECWCLFL